MFDFSVEQFNSAKININTAIIVNIYHAETKQRISDTLKMRYQNGLVPPRSQLGIPHSEITKKRISEANKGIPKSQEAINKGVISRRKYKTIQFDIDGNRLNSFNSCKEAAEYIGTSLVSICKCCNGKSKTSMGFVWKYEPIIK